MAHKLLVVGGNGFVGSAVCRAALGRGWEVTSISSSGTPFRTPKGHTPSWTTHVAWHPASALAPETYRALLGGRTAVVHTVGMLLETARYKEALRGSDVGGLARALAAGVGVGAGGNPLRERDDAASYETVNRDTALRVCETYISAAAHGQRVFVYLSAEDMGRPVVPRRYIATKRAAERGIGAQCARAGVRAVYIRPSLIYHPHLRPLTAPLAALASLSATLHAHAPSFLPTPGRVLRALARAQSPGADAHTHTHPSAPPAPSADADADADALPSALLAMARTLELPPVHVDHVAEAVCRAVEREDVCGAVGLQRMRELIGWRGG